MKKRGSDDKAADDVVARELEAYEGRRAEAQAKLIQAAMDLRRFGVAQADCELDYAVLDR